MKCFIFVIAVVALVSAADEKEKKPEKDQEQKPAEEKHGLKWPLPDFMSEGDLSLHGRISYNRVRDLHKAKVEKDEDKMILSHGRQFLRRVHKFLEANSDFKVHSSICRDIRNLNATNERWRIEIPKEAQLQDLPIPDEKPENATEAPRNNNSSNDNETTTVQPSSERPSSEQPSSEHPSSEQPSSEHPSSERPSEQPSSEKPTDAPVTTVQPAKEKTYEERQDDHYRDMGRNYARLLMREFRKEKLEKEESDYLAHWIADEAVHIGAAGIYCQEGENVKEIKKQLAVFLDEKDRKSVV